MKRRVFYLDAATEAALREQARRHGVTQGAIVRARITGARPGATPGSDAAKADHWWDSRAPKRRVSIYRNHVADHSDTDHDAEQPTIFDGGTR